MTGIRGAIICRGAKKASNEKGLMTCFKVAKGNRTVMKALANYQDFSYADMEDIALILKGIAVHPSGQPEVTLRDGRAVSLTYTKTTRREHKSDPYP